MGATTAAAYAPYMKLVGKGPGAALMAYGGLAGAGGSALYRATGARAYKGRAEKGRTGTLPTDKKILKQLKA